MNSTSANERGGSVALVEGGSVLVGAPGTPGCTTTGFAESICWADATDANDVTQIHAVNRVAHRVATTDAEPGGLLRRERTGLALRGKLKILISRDGGARSLTVTIIRQNSLLRGKNNGDSVGLENMLEPDRRLDLES